MGLEQGLLDQVGRIEPDLQGLADECPGHEPQVIAVELQKPAARGIVAGAGPAQQQLGNGIEGVHLVPGPLFCSQAGSLWRFSGATDHGSCQVA